MKARILMFLILAEVCRADPIAAGAANSRELFALYPVAQAGAEGATAFSFHGALDGQEYTGFFVGPPVVTLADLKSVGAGYPEVGGAPFPAMFFELTDEGFNRLSAYLKQAAPADLVVCIDGHGYSTLAASSIEDIVKRRARLQVLIDKARKDRGELNRLGEKFRGAKPK